MSEPGLVKFLLVEDDDDHAMLAERAIKKARIVNRIDRARDGVEAMQYLRGEGEHAGQPLPNIVLLDLNLPKKSGLEVLAEIRADERLKGIPVVILTTSGDEQDIADAYGNNVNSYLRKPVDFEQFHQMVNDLCLYWGVWNQSPSGEGEK
ncbi:MAG: response regulator [Verrucomicrobiales bacterium]|nr:response regulator [Verrucomicrobiales bacterium]